MGCITWPFKLLVVLLIIGAGAAAWLYRDRLLPGARKLGAPEAVHEIGRPSESGLRSARLRVDSLRRNRADSITLSAGEMASLLGAGLDQTVRGRLDSLQVGLGEGTVQVRAILDTRRLPRELVGPFGIALRDHEPIVAGGPVRMTGPGHAEWDVRQLEIRNFPFPKDVVPKLVEKALGDSARHTLPVTLPSGVSGLRIHPDGVTLYGASPR
ncbi:MAG TPA: hypothetical protein VFL95_09705 [Gemmatimonadales bacterium]|nr:hypothetical protein [Gemmatimonadales bacterium]